MYKSIITFVIVISSLSVFSRAPTSPYHFNGPEFEKLLPFSKSELQIIKEKGFTNVEAVAGNSRTVYHFNKLGQLVKAQTIFQKRKKEIIWGTTHYKYNEKGFLILKQMKGIDREYYDSLAYDSLDRIVHYLSYTRYLNGRKKYRTKEISHNLHLLTSHEDYVVLMDSSEYSSALYTLDNNNQVILIRTVNASGTGLNVSDSVSVEWVSESDYYKRFWYRNELDSTFNVGKELFIKNNLIQSETLWDEARSGERVLYKKYYLYDNNDRLLRIEYDYKYLNWTKSFYTYYDFGLLLENIVVEGDRLTITKFKYWVDR